MLRRSVSRFSRRFCTKAVVCPSLGDSITEGTVASWMKSPGDVVLMDDPVVVIETDKISSDVRSPYAGRLEKQLTEEGEVISIGDELFTIALDDSVQEEPTEEEPAKDENTSASPEGETPTRTEQPKAQPKKEASKPSSKEKATALKPPVGSREERRVPLSRMRLRIAERMKESQNTAASLTTFNEIDMSGIMNIRSKYKDAFQEKHGVKLGFMSIFVKAAAAALQNAPAVNAVIEGNEIVYRDYVDISVAVATPTGLVVPVLRNCESMSFADVEKNIVDLGKRARDAQLALEDMVGGTFTISNGGVYGSLMGTPIINQPQSAILGMHGTFQRPVAINGEVVVRPMMYIALTYDHRIVDGRDAVVFLKQIKSAVEDPTNLLLEL